MADTMKGLKRTHMNGTIESSLLGKEVVLAGWVCQGQKSGKSLFVIKGQNRNVQLVFDGESDKDIFKKAERIRSEYVLMVKGTVRAVRRRQSIRIWPPVKWRYP